IRPADDREYKSDRTGTRSPACNAAQSPFPPSGLALRVEADCRGLEQRVSMRRQLCLFITPLIGVVAACTGPIEPPDGLLDDAESVEGPGASTGPGGTSTPGAKPGTNPGSNSPP